MTFFAKSYNKIREKEGASPRRRNDMVQSQIVFCFTNLAKCFFRSLPIVFSYICVSDMKIVVVFFMPPNDFPFPAEYSH